MLEENIRNELSLLISHYLREKHPEVYSEFEKFCNDNKILPEGCKSVSEALNLRYKNFPNDQFYRVIETLRPNDDYPSIFRRINPFKQEDIDDDDGTLVSMKADKHLYCHDAAIYCICTDPLSRILVTGSDDYTLKLWKIPELTPIMTLAGHEGVISHCCFNSLCTVLLSTSHDKTIRLWDMKTGKCKAVLSGFTDDVIHYAAFSPSGSMIAAACEDKKIQIWTLIDALQGKGPCRTIQTHGGGAGSWVAFSPGGEFLAYSSEPNILIVIILKSMTQYLLDLHTSSINKILFTSRYFVSGGELAPRLISISNDEGMVAVWTLEQNNWVVLHKFKIGTIGRRSGKIHMNATDIDCEEKLLVISKSGSAYIHDLLSGELFAEMNNNHVFNICTCVKGNPVYPEIFFFANSSGDVAIINIHKHEILTQFKIGGEPEFLDAVWSRDGLWVFATDNSGCITSFKCSKNINNEISSMKIYEIYDYIIGKEHYYCNKKGEPIIPQPPKIDIRELNIPLSLTQLPLMKNTAIELKLIERLSTMERQMTSSQSAVIGPPPLHIHLSVECPVNPHDKINEIVDDNLCGDDESTSNFGIVSDTDDWDFQEKDESNISEPCFLISNQIHGNWPNYLSCYYCHDDIYIPQVGDDVFIIWNAYSKLQNKLSIEHEEREGKKRAIIKKIEMTPEKLLNLQLNTGENIIFTYPNDINYIVLVSKFSTSLKIISKIQIGDTVTKSVIDPNNDNMILRKSGKITNISSNIQNEQFESIQVDWGDEQSPISPWEITSINGSSILYDDMPSLFVEFTKYIAEFVNELIQNNKENKPFNDDNSVIYFPMTLEFLHERLSSYYYRSSNSIFNDIQLIYENTVKCYGKDSQEAQDSDEICNSLKSKLRECLKQINRHKKIVF